MTALAATFETFEAALEDTFSAATLLLLVPTLALLSNLLLLRNP